MANDNKPLAVTVATYKDKRHNQQNRLYWSYLKQIATQAMVDGKQYSDEYWRRFMSTKYKDVKEVPTSVLVERLRQLADAVANNRMDEFNMRIPAEVDRDADIVLMEAAKRLEHFRVVHSLNCAA